MKGWMWFVLIVGTAGFLASGCGKSAASVGASKAKVFATADAATKANWERATSALAANDYATAILTLQQMVSQPGLTSEQSQAVADTMATANEQLTAAAAKGDANAKQALQTLKQSRGR